MSRLIGLLLVIGCCRVVAVGDQITTNETAYTGVTVLSADNTAVDFISKGERQRLSFDKAVKIQLDDLANFNMAESLFASGKFAQAVTFYDTARGDTAKDWQIALIAARKAQALERLKRSAVPEEKSPASKPAAASGKTCYFCKGTGIVLCDDCNRTGLAKCANCKGAGKIPCPACKGKWRDRMCPACNGSGVTERAHWNGVGYIRNTYPCSSCGGKGWYFICSTCSQNGSKGQVNCPACGGSGRSGKCPSCNGTKKAPCKHCNSVAAGGTPTTGAVKKDVDGGSLSGIENADPFSSPRAIAAYLQKPLRHPKEDVETWDKMTALQRDEAEKAYDRAVEEHEKNANLRGKNIDWKLTVQDVSLGSKGYQVSCVSGGHDLIVNYPLAARETLIKLRKGDTIQVIGMLKDYRAAGENNADVSPGVAKLVFVVDDASMGTGDSASKPAP